MQLKINELIFNNVEYLRIITFKKIHSFFNFKNWDDIIKKKKYITKYNNVYIKLICI